MIQACTFEIKMKRIKIMKQLLSQRIEEVLEQNYLYASVLHYFGIPFYEYRNTSLLKICKKRNLNPQFIINRMEYVDNNVDNYSRVKDFSLELIIAYLQHAHTVFIRTKLPYFVHLVQKIDPKYSTNAPLFEDVKFIFPHFVEEFIKHIHNEEETVFAYAQQLLTVKDNSLDYVKMFFEMEKKTIQTHAYEHIEEDELASLRALMQNYQFESDAPLEEKVLMSELKAFDDDFQLHAIIENNIFFSQAIELELEVIDLIKKKRTHN